MKENNRLKRVIQWIFNIGIPSGMAPEDAKYILMCNAGVFFFMLFTIPFIIYCAVAAWYLVVLEMFVYAGLLCLTLWINHKGRYTLGLVWFGTVLNWHLVFTSVALGWQTMVHLLIFFTAGGAIMLYRRRATGQMVLAVIGCVACYYIAMVLSRLFPPLYRLSGIELTVLNTSIEITFIILIVVNALIARYGAISAEDLLKEEQAKTEFLLQKIKKLDHQKTQFFQNISHEFRTPLTLITGPVQQALAGAYGPVGQRLKSHLEIVSRNAQRLLRLINQLLDVSRLDAGKMPLKMKTVNLSRLTAAVVDTFQAYADSAGVRIDMLSDQPDVRLWCDAETMEKVVANLVSNALKFTPRDGRITVRISQETERQAVRLVVRDSGIGISEDDLPLIFDRFQQVNGTVGREWDGTGIGLSLVKALVEMHRGTIRVESEKGMGSEFVITIPNRLAKDERPQGEPPARGEAVGMDRVPATGAGLATDEIPAVEVTGDDPDREAATILLVEDNRDMRRYLRESLNDSFRVVEAADGEEGCATAREIIPDLILSDVMMPHMDGCRMFEFLQQEKALQHIPVILLTAKASDELAVQSLAAGVHDYITKPFSVDVLKAKIEAILERQEKNAHLSLTDPLTKMKNRRGWTQDVQRELKRIRRYGGTATMAFVDLDNFKTINDTYGHETGDAVLNAVSSIIRKGLRATDVAGRYGGEEFVVFFPGTSGQAAANCMERILSELRRHTFPNDGLRCSFSAGVAGMEKDPNALSLAQWVSRADAAMYAAKTRGRNCVVQWQPNL